MQTILKNLICCVLQLANSAMEYDPLYDPDKGSNVMPSSFHDIGDVEFQDNWGRVWYKFLDSAGKKLYMILFFSFS